MRKLIQFRASRTAPAQKLLQDYLLRAFPRFDQFARDAGREPELVYAGDKKVSANFVVKAKAMVTAVVPTTSVNLATGPVQPDQVVFSEGGLLLINKPADLATQPTLLASDDNLYHRLILNEILLRNRPARLPYIGLHHRLDRDTSGLVLFTSKASQNKQVADWFQARSINKVYLALVKGDQPPVRWTVEKNIKRQLHDRHKFYFRACERGGQQAESRFEHIGTLANKLHLIKAVPITGRTHQLRVHIKASGLKIIGDRVYGAEAGNKPMRLHAWKMILPMAGGPRTFSAPPPWPESWEITDLL